MTGNGQRCSTAPDWAAGGFRVATIISRRFRCTACGRTRSSDEPELEPGFRMTTSAADELIRAAIRDGVSAAADVGSTDKATTSRLVQARYRAHLAQTQRPSVSRICTLASGKFRISDAISGETVAFFAGSDEGRMVDWLSRPYASVILADAGSLPRAVNWADNFKVCVPCDALRELFYGPLQRSAARMAIFINAPKQHREAVSSALADEIHGSATLPDHIRETLFRPGSAARQFIRLRERIENIVLAEAINEGCRMVDEWLDSCEGAWREIFSSVVQTMDTYRPFMFNHPTCIEAPHQPTSMPIDSSAGLMTLTIAEMNRT